jgi:uncharacterized protein YjbI with pentapeptide repeats
LDRSSGLSSCGEAAESDLQGSNLAFQDLQGANLSGSDLSGSDLAGANLTAADLSGVDLSGANLEGAQLADANLSGADLSGVPPEQIQLIVNQAFIDENTKLPGIESLQQKIQLEQALIFDLKDRRAAVLNERKLLSNQLKALDALIKETKEALESLPKGKKKDESTATQATQLEAKLEGFKKQIEQLREDKARLKKLIIKYSAEISKHRKILKAYLQQQRDEKKNGKVV